MFKISKSLLCFFVFLTLFKFISSLENNSPSCPYTDRWIASAKQKIFKTVLPCGLTVLSYKISNANELYLGITFNIGSKDEQEGEHGFAHMIEHMLFKGTNKMSESDIEAIAEKYYLGAIGNSYNASTSLDTTNYYFLTDKKNWPIFLSVIFDIMFNARLDENHFASEVKAVIQEMFLDKGNINKSFINALFLLFPPPHPYHSPVIGYTEDLAQATAKDLKNFYKKHYTPNQAVLTVVGDIEHNEILKRLASFKELYKNFNKQEGEEKRSYQAAKIPMHLNLSQAKTIFYTPSTQGLISMAWRIPGSLQLQQATDGVIYILENRLQKQLLEQKNIVFSLDVDCFEGLLGGIFFITFEPKATYDKSYENIKSKCINIITQEIKNLSKNGPTQEELNRFKKTIRIGFTKIFESCSAIANLISSSFFTNRNEYEHFENLNKEEQLTDKDIQKFCSDYLRDTFINIIECIPLEKETTSDWEEIKTNIDTYNRKLLEHKIRTTELEKPSLVYTLPQPETLELTLKKPDQEYLLSNGLKVFLKKNTQCPVVKVSLEIKNKEDFSLMLLNNKFPQLCDMVFFILKEGNEKYSKSDHDNFFADYGASWNFGNTGGYFSCLWEDFVPVAQRFVYILSTPEYSQNNISREIISRLNKIQQNQKEPTHIASNKLALYLFKEYSWVISDLDKCELIARYNHDTFVSFHKNFITPDNLFLVIVGNYDETSIITDLEKTFGQWKPASNATIPPDAKIPEISNPPAKHFEYYIPTDQVFIFGGRITNYCSSRDYLALFLLESYLNKKLFEIREQSGSCYAIDGNLSAYAFIKTKGFASVCAYTSQDNINAIEEKIKNVLYDTCSFGISEEELKTYKESYLMDLAKSCNTSSEEISTYNFIIANNKTWDYYLDRYKTVESLTLDEVNNVAKKYLNPEEWTFIHVGRIKSG